MGLVRQADCACNRRVVMNAIHFFIFT